MSIQSDIEMLSIEALEYYAKKHQLSEDDAFNIFYKHHGTTRNVAPIRYS